MLVKKALLFRAARYKHWVAAAVETERPGADLIYRFSTATAAQAHYCCPVEKLLEAALAEWDDYEKSFRFGQNVSKCVEMC
jgi:hypothetical protein